MKRSVPPWALLAATAVITVGVLAVLVATNLPLERAALGLGYEALVVAVPGLILSVCLRPGDRSLLRHAALAWPLGVAIELLAFTVAAMLDVRFLAAPGQLAVGAALAATPTGRSMLQRLFKRAKSAVGEATFGGVLMAAIIAAGSLVILVFQYYFPSPLPTSAAAVQYYVDVPFHIALAAEAANHWPMMDPNLAGESLRYHIFSYMHIAAVHEATGLGVDEVVLRTFPIAPLLATMIVLVALGRELGGRFLTGGIAVLLLLFVGEFDFDSATASPFFNVFLSNLWYSPSLLFSLPICGGIFLLLIVRDESRTWASWLALALLVAVGSGAKASVVPVVLGGLLLHIAWCRIFERRWSRNSITAFAVALPVFVLFFFLLFSGGTGSAFTLSFGDFVDYTVFANADASPMPLLAKLAWSPFALGLMLLSLVGIIPLLLAREATDQVRLLLGMLVAGLSLLLVLSQEGANQAYFGYSGFLAGVVLSAHGIVLTANRLRGIKSTAPLVAAGLVPALGGIALVLYTRTHGPASEALILACAGALLILIALLALLWADGRADGRRWAGPVAVLVAAALAAGAIDVPGDIAADARAKVSGEIPYTVATPPFTLGVSTNVIDALHWIRDNTDEDAVLAVNNQWITRAPERGLARFFDYSAFSERRTFLGGWEYSNIGRQEDLTPLQARFAANKALLRANSCAALRSALQGAPVQYVVYDHFNGGDREALSQALSPVYENADVTIFDVSEGCPG